MTRSPGRSSFTPRTGRTPTRSRGATPTRRDKDKDGAQARSVDVLHRLFQAGRAAGRPADHLPVQRRPGLVDRVAAHGRVRAGARADRGRRTRPRLIPSSTTTRACSTRATSCSSTRPAPASAASPARTRKRPSTASTRTSTPSPQFITQFLTKYGRWNSPKYLFGESYGTMRARRAGARAAERRTST